MCVCVCVCVCVRRLAPHSVKDYCRSVKFVKVQTRGVHPLSNILAITLCRVRHATAKRRCALVPTAAAGARSAMRGALCPTPTHPHAHTRTLSPITNSPPTHWYVPTHPPTRWQNLATASGGDMASLDNLLLFVHGVGNLILANALHLGVCQLGPSTKWLEAQSGRHLSALADWGKHFCSVEEPPLFRRRRRLRRDVTGTSTFTAFLRSHPFCGDEGDPTVQGRRRRMQVGNGVLASDWEFLVSGRGRGRGGGGASGRGRGTLASVQQGCAVLYLHAAGRPCVWGGGGGAVPVLPVVLTPATATVLRHDACHAVVRAACVCGRVTVCVAV